MISGGGWRSRLLWILGLSFFKNLVTELRRRPNLQIFEGRRDGSGLGSFLHFFVFRGWRGVWVCFFVFSCAPFGASRRGGSAPRVSLRSTHGLRSYAASRLERLYPHLKGSKSTVLPLARISALKIPLVCAVDVRRCWAGLFLRPSRGWAAGGLVPWADAQGCSCFAADAARCGSPIELHFSLIRVIRLFPAPLSGLLVVGVRHPGFRFAPPMGYDPTPLRGLKSATFCLSHFAYHVEVPTVGRLGEEVSQ